MKRTIHVIALAAVLTLAACSSETKKENSVALGKSVIEYQGDSLGVAHAQRLGRFLAAEGIIDSAQDDKVRLSRDKKDGIYTVRIDRDDSLFNKNQDFYNLGMWKLQDAIRYEVFGGIPTRLVLNDAKGKEAGAIGDMRIVHPNPVVSIIYDPTVINESQVANLSGFVDELSATPGQPTIDVVVRKKGDQPRVDFFMEEGYFRQNPAALQKQFEEVKYLLSKTAFGGRSIDVVLNSLGYYELARIGDPSPADKALLDQELAAQQAGMAAPAR